MSFTINRTYVLKPGKNYNPASNGNRPYSFNGETTIGESIIRPIGQGATSAINQVIAINGASGTAVIEGGNFIGRIPVGVTSGTGITGTVLVISGTASSSGTLPFRIFDGDVPNTNDSPILAIHVLADPGAVNMVTLSDNAISFPSGAFSAKGIYDYGVGSIVSLGTSGTLLGLAPAVKPYII
jgi:hypothetical protein